MDPGIPARLLVFLKANEHEQTKKSNSYKSIKVSLFLFKIINYCTNTCSWKECSNHPSTQTLLIQGTPPWQPLWTSPSTHLTHRRTLPWIWYSSFPRGSSPPGVLHLNDAQNYFARVKASCRWQELATQGSRWTGSQCAGVLIPSAPVQGRASTCALHPTAAHTPGCTSSTGDRQPAWGAVLRRDIPFLPLI